MPKVCEYCGATCLDDAIKCPVCGSSKFIDLKRYEEERKRKEAERIKQLEEIKRETEKAMKREKQKRIFFGFLRSISFIGLGLILWILLLIIFILPAYIPSTMYNISPDNPFVMAWVIISLFITLYLGFKISYKLTIKRKKKYPETET